MADTFEADARAKFKIAEDFLDNSRMILDNDTFFVAALADAVSATKNVLQAYLFTQMARKPEGTVPQSWREAADGNSTPDILIACKAAGLSLPGELEERLMKANSARNRRTHDRPKRLIYHTRAREALQVAEQVRRLVFDTVGVAPDLAESAPAIAAASTPDTAASVAAEAAAPAIPGVDILDDHDEGIPPAASRSSARIRQLRRVLGRVAAVLLVLLVGMAAGVGVTIPIASGNAPSWLDFAVGLVPARSTVVSAPTAIPTATAPTAPNAPINLGMITASATGCAAGEASFQLHNAGAAPVRWTVGSPGATAPAFSLTAGGTPKMTLFGTLASNSTVTIYAAENTPVVLTTDDGAVQFPLPTC
ncbi:MAG TPA: hypothetical protein VF040_14570 [Ktedonobacterales bacterium]